MPSIVKPLSVAVNIGASGGGGAASTVSDAALVSVTNMGSVAELVIVAETGNGVYISPGATVYIEKEPTQTLDGTGAAAAIWATSIAYRT